MAGETAAALVDVTSDAWPAEVDRLREMLGAPANPRLFPAHFLKATFPKIGGQAVRVSAGGRPLGAGFLFPRGIEGERSFYTLRFHRAAAGTRGDLDPDIIVQQVEDLLGGAGVIFYDPAVPQAHERTSEQIEGIDVGQPDAGEARAMRALAETIWGSDPDALYPSDIGSAGFASAAALVARLGGEVVGFLFGFVKFGGSPLPPVWQARHGGRLRLESQLLGVDPAARQHGIAALLKRVQGAWAAAGGIGVVNWTVDPLQFGNAVLNLGRLRALAYDFYPDYYPFRNALNQVRASRLGITWLVHSERVREILAQPAPAAKLDLAAHPDVPRANDGPDARHVPPDAARFAIEVPADWTRLQHSDLRSAQAWRATTDDILARTLGPEDGQYALTGVAQDGARVYLVAERIGPDLLQRYGT